MKIKLGHGNIAICSKGNKIKFYDAEMAPLGDPAGKLGRKLVTLQYDNLESVKIMEEALAVVRNNLEAVYEASY